MVIEDVTDIMSSYRRRRLMFASSTNSSNSAIAVDVTLGALWDQRKRVTAYNR